jgi:hypothetical protein
MRKTFRILLVFGLCSVFTFAKAQAPKEEHISSNKSSLKEDAMKAKSRRIETKKTGLATINKPIVKSPIDENDTYMGRKAEFLGNLTVSELPSDFPVYDKSYGLRYYNNLVDNFYGSHKDILQEKVKVKIDQHYPSGNNQKINNAK